MEMKDLLTLIGILVSIVIGTAGLIISILNSRRTIFINSITSSRIKYIQDVRNSISDYCSLSYKCATIMNDNLKSPNDKLEIMGSLNKLKYQIMLYLNPEDEIWDKKIINLIDLIRDNLEHNPEEHIHELILIAQYLLQLEWKGAKLESQNGLISDKRKLELNKKYIQKYQDHKQRLDKKIAS